MRINKKKYVRDRLRSLADAAVFESRELLELADMLESSRELKGENTYHDDDFVRTVVRYSLAHPNEKPADVARKFNVHQGNLWNWLNGVSRQDALASL